MESQRSAYRIGSSGLVLRTDCDAQSAEGALEYVNIKNLGKSFVEAEHSHPMLSLHLEGVDQFRTLVVPRVIRYLPGRVVECFGGVACEKCLRFCECMRRCGILETNGQSFSVCSAR